MATNITFSRSNIWLLITDGKIVWSEMASGNSYARTVLFKVILARTKALINSCKHTRMNLWLGRSIMYQH